MSLDLLFWILMLLWLIGYGYSATRAPFVWPVIGPNILLFILLVILGWRVFGSAVKG
jgi:hypothetical protein